MATQSVRKVRPVSDTIGGTFVRKLSNRRFGALAVLLSAALLAGACGSKTDDKSSSTTAAGESSATSAASSGDTGGEIKVGILHSLSGTMAISEVTVKNSELMAIDEINAAGGVMGKKVVPVV